jgi:hypothetical protein
MATRRTSFEPGLAVSTVFDQIGPLQEQLAYAFKERRHALASPLERGTKRAFGSGE